MKWLYLGKKKSEKKSFQVLSKEQSSKEQFRDQPPNFEKAKPKWFGQNHKERSQLKNTRPAKQRSSAALLQQRGSSQPPPPHSGPQCPQPALLAGHALDAFGCQSCSGSSWRGCTHCAKTSSLPRVHSPADCPPPEKTRGQKALSLLPGWTKPYAWKENIIFCPVLFSAGASEMQMMANFTFLKLSAGPLLSILLVTAELLWKTRRTGSCEGTG